MFRRIILENPVFNEQPLEKSILKSAEVQENNRNFNSLEDVGAEGREKRKSPYLGCPYCGI